MYRNQNRDVMFPFMHDLRSQLAEPETRLRIEFPGEIIDADVQVQAGNEILISDDADSAYRQFFTEMNEGAAILNADRIVVRANSALAGILGVPPGKLSGVPISNWIAPSDRVIFETSFQNARQGVPSRCVIRVVREQGSPTPVLFSLAPISGGFQERLGAVVVELPLSPQMQNALREPEIETLDLAENASIHFEARPNAPEAYLGMHPPHLAPVSYSRNPQKDRELSGNPDTLRLVRGTPQKRNPVPDWRMDPKEGLIRDDADASGPNLLMQALLRVLSAPRFPAARHGSKDVPTHRERHHLPKLATENPKHLENTDFQEELHSAELAGTHCLPVSDWDRMKARNLRKLLPPVNSIRSSHPAQEETQFAAPGDNRPKDARGLFEGMLTGNREPGTMEYQANLAASLSYGIVVADMEMRIQSWNPAAEILYGWTVAEVMDHSVDEILPTRFQNISGAMVLREVLETECWKGEAIQQRRDGTRFPVRITLTLLRDRCGAPLGLVAVCREITEW